MTTPSYQELLLENQHLRQRVAQLEQMMGELQQRLEASERAAKRQAAPFSSGPPKQRPQRPGRKSGAQHGRHAHRPPPPPDQVDETHDAPLPPQCPDCGGPLIEDSLDQQFQTEIPRRPLVRQFTIHCGHCQNCGKQLRGRHPLQTSAATGAAQSQLGPDAQAAVVYLNKHAGLSYGKISATFRTLYGITLTPGAGAQIVRRAGRLLQPVYETIQEHIRNAKHLTPDETGWRVGGHPAWLHDWVGDDGATLYAIDPQRSAVVLERIIGRDWSGSMTHDGFASYERFEEAIHQQCVDHALRRARGLVEKQQGVARAFPRQVIELFTNALQLRDQLNEVSAGTERREHAYDEATQRLLELTERPRRNAANERFAQHLYQHAECWFVFLLDPTIPATNHRAEQALKTPIVNRKVWGGNRTQAGAQSQAVINSVLQTCRNRAVDAFTFLSDAFRGVLGNLFS